MAAEKPSLGLLQREMAIGAVDGEQAQPVPGGVKAKLLELALKRLVEALKGLGQELVTGLGEGLGGDLARLEGRLLEHLKELIQFGLQGALGLVEHKEGEAFEGQCPLTAKVLW